MCHDSCRAEVGPGRRARIGAAGSRRHLEGSGVALHGKKLAEQAGLHQGDLSAIRNAAAVQMQAEQGKRLALEQRLSASEQTHYKELNDAQTKQARLRDRLATSDLRLSVLLAEDSGDGCSVSSPPEPAAWFMEERVPDLTQRMLNELSVSRRRRTGD